MLNESAQNQSKKELINLIKTLPAKEIPAVKRFVEFVIAAGDEPYPGKKNGKRTLAEYLANAPEEEVSEEELKHLKRISRITRKEAKEGKLVPLKNLKEKYGI